MANTSKKQTEKVIKPGKDITADNADDLKQKLQKIAEQGCMELTLDFDQVKTIDPVGLSIIIAAHNTLNNTDGKLSLKNVSDDFLKMFEAIRLDQYFDLH